ncbi:MAG: PEP-CTERM sorting domain-containing protein [Tepidisphaeraceae bacterium]|jgi:hypothetical protein
MSTFRFADVCILLAAVLLVVSRPANAQTIVATGVTDPSDLVLNGSNLYFTDDTATNGAIDAVSTNGGGVSTLATGVGQYDNEGTYRAASSIAISGSKIYGDYDSYESGPVFSVPLSGGSATALAYPEGGTFLGVSGSSLYYSSGFQTIQQLPLSGGSPTQNASGIWVRAPVADNTGVYFQNYYGQNIDYFNYSTHSVTTVASGLPQNTGPVLDSTNVYLDLPSGAIDVVPKSGGLPTQIVSSGNALAASNGNVFYTTGNNVEQYSTSAKTSIQLATVANGTVTSMATDGNWVYYSVANGNAGQIEKVPVGLTTPAPKTTVLSVGVNWDTDTQNVLRGDVAAANVASAFGQFVGAQNTQSLRLNASAGESANVTTMQNAIASLVDASNPDHLKAGDTAVFYINTHGAYQDYFLPLDQSIPGPDASITAEADPNHEPNPPSSLTRTTTADGQLAFGGASGSRVYLDDDDLRAMFSGSAWVDINKLFLIDSCFSGHCIGADDLSSLPDTAVITSSAAGESSDAILLPGQGVYGGAFGADLVGAIDSIYASGNPLTFDALKDGVNAGAGQYAGQLGYLEDSDNPVTIGSLDPQTTVAGGFDWTVSVPEPTSLVLVISGILFCAGRRRRDSSAA